MEEPEAEPRIKRAWTYIAAWIAGITAVLGFIGAVSGSFQSAWDFLHRNGEIRSEMAFAQSEVAQGEYPEADGTYAKLLQAHPRYRPALEGRLAATEQWVREFYVVEQDGKSATSSAASYLDQIFPILDRGLVDTKGTERADVQAHLGWAHWLNQHIAEREFGPLAEQSLRGALSEDPKNVYANAMLGNWLLQNHGELAEALQHFDTAVSSGRERPFVRRFQVAALMHLEAPGARAALYQAVNDMRRHAEPLPDDSARRVLSFCCVPGMSTDEELTAALTAVSREDAWQTYTWLDSRIEEDGPQKGWKRQFVQARLAELAGERASALALFRSLQADLKGKGSSMDEDVARSIARLGAAAR